MADEATQATEVAPVEETTAAPATEIKTEEPTSQSTEATPDDASGKTDEVKPDASTGDNKQSENQDSKDGSKDSKESKPLSRRSAAYRIQQLVDENKILKEQLKPKEQDDWEAQTDDKPDIAALVAQEVEKRLNPVISESSKVADDKELSDLFADKPEQRAKYESKIRSMWNLPQYKDVAAADLYKMLDHDSIAGSIAQVQAKAIEEHKKAEKEAKESSASGTSNSNRTGKTKSVADMTPQQLEEHNQRVIAGRS